MKNKPNHDPTKDITHQLPQLTLFKIKRARKHKITKTRRKITNILLINFKTKLLKIEGNLIRYFKWVVNKIVVTPTVNSIPIDTTTTIKEISNKIEVLVTQTQEEILDVVVWKRYVWKQ